MWSLYAIVQWLKTDKTRKWDDLNGVKTGWALLNDVNLSEAATIPQRTWGANDFVVHDSLITTTDYMMQQGL